MNKTILRLKNLKLSRMTEFAKYGEIISRCMGNEDNEFLRVYKENRNLQVDEIIEYSPVATLLMCMMYRKYDDPKYEWDGTPTALYTEIKNIANTEKWDLNIDVDSKIFPKSVNSFTRRLNEVKPVLKAKGLLIKEDREKTVQRTKKITIRKVSSISSIPSKIEKSRSNLDNPMDDTYDNDKTASSIPSINNNQNHAQNKSLDDMDDMDGILHSSISADEKGAQN